MAADARRGEKKAGLDPAQVESIRQQLEAAVAPEVMDTEQAARFLGCSTQFLEIARLRGDSIPYSKLGPRMVRYRKAALLQYLADREQRSTSEDRE